MAGGDRGPGTVAVAHRDSTVDVRYVFFFAIDASSCSTTGFTLLPPFVYTQCCPSPKVWHACMSGLVILISHVAQGGLTCVCARVSDPRRCRIRQPHGPIQSTPLLFFFSPFFFFYEGTKTGISARTFRGSTCRRRSRPPSPVMRQPRGGSTGRSSGAGAVKQEAAEPAERSLSRPLPAMGTLLGGGRRRTTAPPATNGYAALERPTRRKPPRGVAEAGPLGWALGRRSSWKRLRWRGSPCRRGQEWPGAAAAGAVTRRRGLWGDTGLVERRGIQARF